MSSEPAPTPEQDALEAERARLRAVLQLLPVGVSLADAQGRVVEKNAAAEALWGPPGAEGPEAWWPDSGRLLEEREWPLERALRTGQPVLEQEVEMLAADGSPRTLLTSAVALRAPDGAPGGAVAVHMDITARKATERAGRFLSEASRLLAESLEWETTLAAVARLATRGLCDYCLVDVLDEEGRMQRLAVCASSPARQALLDKLRPFPAWVEGDVPLGRPFQQGHSLLVPEVGPEWLDALARSAEHRALLEALGPRSVMVVPLVAGTRRFGLLIFASAHPARRYGLRELAVAEEFARRAALALENARLYRAGQQALAARDELVAIATHELRTPLSTLHLQLGALHRAAAHHQVPPPERLCQALELALRQTERMERMVGYLLDISRLASGRLELELERVDLTQLVQRLVARFEEPLAQVDSLALVHAPRPVHARVDRLRVEQVLTNLLSNAMKYAPGQPVELSVEQAGEDALVSVCDGGPGIPPEAQVRIFERYQRASGTHTRSSLGLGLYISRQVARAHGGELSVQSAPGQGARFLLRLPREPS